MKSIKIMDFCDQIDDKIKIDYFDNTIYVDGMFDGVQFYDIKKEIKKKWFEGNLSKKERDCEAGKILDFTKLPKPFTNIPKIKIYIIFYGEFFYIKCFEDLIILIEFFSKIVTINTNDMCDIAEENYNILEDLFTYLKSLTVSLSETAPLNQKWDFIYRKIKYLYHPDYKQNGNHIILGLQEFFIEEYDLTINFDYDIGFDDEILNDPFISDSTKQKFKDSYKEFRKYFYRGVTLT